MTALIEFAGIIGALLVSVVTAFLMTRLWFEAFFRTLGPCWHVAAAVERPADTAHGVASTPPTDIRRASGGATEIQ